MDLPPKRLKRCPDCKKDFELEHGLQKRCPRCQIAFDKERERRRSSARWKKEQQNRDKKLAQPKVEMGSKRYLFRTDFLLALPEMRREYERVLLAADASIFVPSFDPTEIPVSTHRRRKSA